MIKIWQTYSIRNMWRCHYIELHITMLFLTVLSLCLSVGSVSPSALHRSEFCNSSTDEIIVGSSGHLEGVIFSPNYPAKHHGGFIVMPCTITISGLHRGIALKLSVHHPNPHDICFKENLHEYQDVIPEFRLIRLHGYVCSTTVEKTIWEQSTIRFALDSTLHSYDGFFIKYEVFPAFITAPHGWQTRVGLPGTIYRINTGRYPHGLVGVGPKYYLNIDNFEPSQQPSSSGSPAFPYFKLLNNRVMNVSHIFQLVIPYRTAKLTYEFEYLKFANQSRAGLYSDVPYLRDSGMRIYHLQCSVTLFPCGTVDVISNSTSRTATVEFVYGSEEAAVNEMRQPDDGFILRFASESCDEDIENLAVAGIQRLPPANSSMFRVDCQDGYELADQLSKVYQCLGRTWSPQKPICLTASQRYEGSNLSDITDKPRDIVQIPVESDSLPITVTLGVTVLLLLIATIYIIILKSQLTRAQYYRASSMVDVVIPRETGNVLSLPSSYNTDPGMLPEVAIPVELGAALDPDIPSPPLTPHPLRRYRSKKRGSYKPKPGNQVDTGVQQEEYHDSHHCLDITPATEGKGSSIDQSQSSIDLNRSGSTISDSNRSVSPLGDKSMTGGGNLCINIMNSGTTSGSWEVQDQGNYTPTAVISDNLSEDNPAFDNDD